MFPETAGRSAHLLYRLGTMAALSHPFTVNNAEIHNTNLTAPPGSLTAAIFSSVHSKQ